MCQPLRRNPGIIVNAADADGEMPAGAPDPRIVARMRVAVTDLDAMLDRLDSTAFSALIAPGIYSGAIAFRRGKAFTERLKLTNNWIFQGNSHTTWDIDRFWRDHARQFGYISWTVGASLR